jgi:hypothetical protein
MHIEKFKRPAVERVSERGQSNEKFQKRQQRVAEMTDRAINAGVPSKLFLKENLVLLVGLIVLLLSFIGTSGFYSHHGNLRVNCCGAAFWWSPVGCSVVLVAASLLLRLRTVAVYPVVILMSLFALGFSSYVAFQRWIDYQLTSKGYALQQALLPLYRPLTMVLSVVILGIAVRRVLHWLPASKNQQD